MSLSLALRYVLDSLKKPPTTKMYLFGLAALDKFKPRLKEFPQYCGSIICIPHFQQFPMHLKQVWNCACIRMHYHSNDVAKVSIDTPTTAGDSGGAFSIVPNSRLVVAQCKGIGGFYNSMTAFYVLRYAWEE